MTPEMDAGIPTDGNENASNSDDTQPSSNPSSDQLIDAMATAMRGIPEVPREIPNGPFDPFTHGVLDHFDPFTHGGPLGVHGLARNANAARTVRERLAGFKDSLGSRLDRIEKRLEQLMAMTSFVQTHISSFQHQWRDPIEQLNPAPQPSIGVDPRDPSFGTQGLTEDEVKYLAALEAQEVAAPSPQTLCEEPNDCGFPNCLCDKVDDKREEIDVDGAHNRVNQSIGIHIEAPRDPLTKSLPTTPADARARKVLTDLTGGLKLFDIEEAGRVRLLFSYWEIVGVCAVLESALYSAGEKRAFPPLGWNDHGPDPLLVKAAIDLAAELKHACALDELRKRTPPNGHNVIPVYSQDQARAILSVLTAIGVYKPEDVA